MSDIFQQISVNPQRGITLAHQVKQQITWMIAGGQLKTGNRLPAVRRLAQHLSINLHTVRNAYRMLEAEGLVETHQGKGTFVLSFDPVSIAQAASAIRSHTVGVILPTLSNPFYHAFLRGVEEVADEDRTLLFVCNTQDDAGEAWRYFTQLTASQVDGIIVASGGVGGRFYRGLDPKGRGSSTLPLVSADWPEHSGPSVVMDLEGAAYQATEHLLAHNHSQIGLITHANEVANVKPVNAGYYRALREAGIQRDPALIIRVAGFDIAAGAEGARKLLSLSQPPSAIFAITDLMAAGALQAIRAAGLRVPQDIALVGFNDIPLAAMLDPPLTTVTAPAYPMGQTSMRMLQDIIAGKRLKHTRIVLPTSLIVRQSCGEHTQ